jgi:positive phototaxis protein PixI
MPITDSFSRLEQLLPQLFETQQQPGEAYLRFLLTPDLPCLIPMEAVQESLRIPVEEITPIPNLPEWMLGLINARNAVFSVVDLAQILGLPTLVSQPRHYHIVVAQAISPDSGEILLGLMVHKIQGLTRLVPKQIQATVGAFPEGFTPYLQGCVAFGEERAMVLSLEAIARHLWQS